MKSCWASSRAERIPITAAKAPWKGLAGVSFLKFTVTVAAALRASSRASSLPPVRCLARDHSTPHYRCRSALARELAGASGGNAAAGNQPSRVSSLLPVRCLARDQSTRITHIGARLPANWQVCPVEMQRLEIGLREQARSCGSWVWPESSGIPGDLCGSELAHEGAGSVAITVVAVHRCPFRDSLFRHVLFRLRPTAAKRAESRHGRPRVVGA